MGMKTDLLQSCGHCWVFQICWHIECSTFTASSFRIWNSSTGIPSPPLVLFIVMLPKAHFTSHSRMSGSTWVITPHGYLGHEGLFLYSSSEIPEDRLSTCEFRKGEHPVTHGFSTFIVLSSLPIVITLFLNCLRAVIDMTSTPNSALIHQCVFPPGKDSLLHHHQTSLQNRKSPLV